MEEFIRQLQSTDTPEDTLITFPRRLLQMCISVVLKGLCVVIAWEALKTCMLQHCLEPTEPKAPGIILGHLYFTKAFSLILKSLCYSLGPLVYFCEQVFFSQEVAW